MILTIATLNQLLLPPFLFMSYLCTAGIILYHLKQKTPSEFQTFPPQTRKSESKGFTATDAFRDR